MLKTVIIKNFRSLRDINVPLRPLSVLIGPNDSGKSAFLGALEYLTGRRNLDQLDPWRAQPIETVGMIGALAGGKVTREGNTGYQWGRGHFPLLPLSLYQLPSSGVSMTSQGYSDEGSPPEIDSSGNGIPALLDHLLRRDRKRFFELVAALRALINGLEEVEIATPNAGTRRVDLVIEQGFRIPADRTSVGLRLVLFFVALAYHPSPAKLILVEEPENGVHPKRLADVMRLLREITQGRHGAHSSQIVLTTHSPHLLDHVNLESDQVLVFRRNEDGSRSAEPADAERLKTFLDEFMLGEVWYNQGEAGLVKPTT